MAINMIMAKLDNLEKKIFEVSSIDIQSEKNDDLSQMFSERLSNVEQAIEKLIAKVGIIESNFVSYQQNMETVQSKINTLFTPGEQ